MSAEALTDDECDAIASAHWLRFNGTPIVRSNPDERALIRAGYKAGATAMAETCAKACEARQATSADLAHRVDRNRMYRYMELAEGGCAQACRDAARGKT